MAMTRSHVADSATAQALRRAAIGAGMLARIEETRAGLRVTIDHAEDRRDSALNLVEIYTRAQSADHARRLLELIVAMPSPELDSSAAGGSLRHHGATMVGRQGLGPSSRSP